MPDTLRPMPSKRSPPAEEPKKKRPSDTIRIDEDLARKLATIKTALGISAKTFVSPLIRKEVEAKFAEAVASLKRLQGDQGGAGR